GHIKALEKVSEKTDVYIYNLCSGEGTSVLQLVNTFESVNKIPIPYKIVPRRSGDVATCYANADKAYKELNWRTTKSIEDMCRDTWN
ncbi:GDP-mannose 4,6-dehydratase, partial [Streptococcus pneumoniae]